MILVQLLINGFITGAVYALVASGFSLIYSTNKFIHFAHGAVIAFSAYILYFLFSVLELYFWFSIVLSIAFASFLGYLMNYVVYNQLRKKNSSVILLIASFGLLILLESIINILFGADVKIIDFIKVSKGLEFLGAIITPLQIFIVFVSVILFVCLYLFMKNTNLGKAMRAVSDNSELAEIIGISSEKIYSWSFIIGSAIAGLAAILIGLEQNLDPTMGSALMIKGFAATIIVGIGNIHGAILGGFILGIIENVGIWYLPSGFKEAIAFVILCSFLIFKPQGILGRKRGAEK